MPWSNQLDNYYNSFGNGYVPYFAVIGADYEYLHGSNNVSSAMNSAGNAMLNMADISVLDPISNVFIDANSSTTIDISNTFQHSQGAAMTYSITDNTNPDCCEAYISGTTVYLDAQVTGGITNITVTAQSGNLSCDDTFIVTVNDIYPVPVNPVGIVLYPEVQLSWQEPEAVLPITGWSIYRDDAFISNVPAGQLFYNDQPGDGTYIYTIRTEFLVLISGPSDPVEITIFNTPGDIDESGVIDCFDASLVLHYVSGIQHPDYPYPWADWLIDRADVDGNGTVEAYDSSLILQYIVGLIGEL